jgi:outer membrane receptor protein involved in Fe transport
VCGTKTENIRISKLGLNTDIKPEKTTDFEGELGYQIGDNMFLTANIFDISIKDAIIYDIDTNSNGSEVYKNYASTGSSGFEIDYKTKYQWGYASVNYSYTNPVLFKRNSVPLYEVPGHNDVMLAFPQHKISFNAAIYLGSLCIGPSASFLSTRYAYDSTNLDGAVYTSPKEPLFLCNFHLRYEDLFVKGLDVGAGVYDILNQRYEFIQPYQGEKPWPGPSREFVFRVTYGLKL